ncbi:MAG: DNA protecting protein DprA [Anaerolineaceae bacterium 4572_32.2]|nr:MAG: DNA protecting protein DprA [Anaerolineaceae bacterium 4572_32.2]
MSDLRYWVGFNIVRGIGPVRLRALLDYFGDVERAWRAPAEALRSAGLDSRSLKNLLQVRGQRNLDRELERIEAAGARALTWESAHYPHLLREIHDPPSVLYVKGTLTEEDAWAIAVVGTRRASVYGREVTRQLTQALARNGITIVSGLARGIDSEAHRAALEAGGRTIAVLGCGIDRVYPPENRKLAQQIIARGALVSSYPLGTPPEGRNFPARNRIISGLSLGVLVTDAGTRSGALITTDFAAEQGRDVFAVPGSVLARGSVGTNALIQDGAKVVLKPEDILEELNLTMVAEQSKARQVLPADETEEALLDHLSTEPTHVDELQQQLELPIAQVTSTLALMELKGMVRQAGGMKYIVAREPGVEYVVE